MAKKKGHRGGKDKGKGRYNQRAGLGRLRRAHAQTRQRMGNLEHLAADEDHDEVAQVESSRSSHSGESLLAKFNRQARDTDAGCGQAGVVCGIEGSRITVRTDAGTEQACEIRTVLKKMLAGVKSPLCVGDSVRWEMPDGDEEVGVITSLAPRRNQLTRADSHNKALVHVFAANVDRLVIVGTMAMPDLKPGLIDRYLVIAHYNDIEPVIVLNKAELADPELVIALYESLGYTVIATQAAAGPDDPGIIALRTHLAGTTCVFAGQSGVGKSSLVHALYPDVAIRIGDVSNALHKGRHTTTAARSYLMPDGSCLIDTPGIRECAITGLTPLDVALLYPDLAALHHACRFANCTHQHEPGCAVLAAVDAGLISPSRYLSYCSIVDEDLAAG